MHAVDPRRAALMVADVTLGLIERRLRGNATGQADAEFAITGIQTFKVEGARLMKWDLERFVPLIVDSPSPFELNVTPWINNVLVLFSLKFTVRLSPLSRLTPL